MKKRNILTILALILIILFIILFVIFLLNKRKDNNENKNILVENENIVENQTSLDENIVEENSDSENVENIENVKNDENSKNSGNSEDTENVTIKENERYIGNYVNRTKTIPAVTHTEDQGYWETYVDYQYCDCGARRGV